MTIRARWVLQDCEAAFTELKENTDALAWKRRWFNFISLARAVGHVLSKVDVNKNEVLKLSINEWWKRINANKEQHAIFFHFIESERNDLLKEYSTNAYFSESIKSDWKTKQYTVTLTSKFSRGYFEGKNTLEVAQNALTWWKEQLDSIEKQTINNQERGSSERQRRS